MAEKYLIDTAIWIDAVENRTGFLGEPIGEYAMALFHTIIVRRSNIVISQEIIKELEKHYSIAEINAILKPFENLIQKIKIRESLEKEAIIIAEERRLPKGDVLHAMGARDSEAKLVTRDRHFKLLEDIAKPYLPEELI
jgi:predicted nucleic acid-binding protein